MAADLAGFERRRCVDGLQRTVTYYVRPAPEPAGAQLLFDVQGSGCHSVFVTDRNGRVRARQQGVLARVAGDATVVAVEKPGVRFLADPGPTGSAVPCGAAFRREHTLERWVEAVGGVLRHELTKRAYDRIGLVGHSEGGIVAAAVARRDHRVTDVAVLSSSGPSQLFDLLASAPDRATRVERLRSAIARDPGGLSLELGHPLRRWSSFLATSCLDELIGSTARVLIVHGRNDEVVPIAAARVLYAELLRHGRDVRLVEREAGHNLRLRAQSQARALDDVFTTVVGWMRAAGS